MDRSGGSGGAAIHVAVCAAWGALFAQFLPRRASLRGSLLWSLCFGLVVLLVTTLLALPVASALAARVRLAPFWWFTLHVAFGACLALVVPFRRTLRWITRTSAAVRESTASSSGAGGIEARRSRWSRPSRLT